MLMKNAEYVVAGVGRDKNRGDRGNDEQCQQSPGPGEYLNLPCDRPPGCFKPPRHLWVPT